MKPITQLIICTFLFISPLYIYGTHIIGGTVDYITKGISDGMGSLDVYLYLYRDAESPAQFDDNIEVGIYGYTNGGYEFIRAENVSSIAIENYSEPCTFESINHQAGLYLFSTELPISEFEYFKIAYQRCCRDNSITNVLFPEETGLAISMDIYPYAFELGIQQIFSFKNSFPAHVEPGKETEFDVSVNGSEVIEYYLSTPKVAGGTLGSTDPGDPFDCKGIIPSPMNCLPEFDDVQYIDSLNPYGPGAVLNLDKTTGILNVKIPQVSKNLVAMTMHRFNDDQLVSVLRQQFIINSSICTTSINPSESDIHFTYWPNPAQENIRFSHHLKNVVIYNLKGQNQSTITNKEWYNEADLSLLSKGIYLLRGQNEDGQWISRKVVKL